MSTLAGDLRYALRSMRSHAGFTAVAVASLALGIGVNASIFSLVDQLLLWSVPARDPASLVRIEGAGIAAYPFYREFRSRTSPVFSDMFAGSRPVRIAVRPEGAAAAELAELTYVSGAYFSTLGTGAAAGRLIQEQDAAAPRESAVVVLSYAYWQRRFAAAPDVLGHKFLINGFPFEIAGIAEKGFTGLFNGQPADGFIPLTMYPATTPASARIWDTPNMSWLYPMGRLKFGVSMAKAQAAMRAIWPTVQEAVNDASVKKGGRRRKFDRYEPVKLSEGAHVNFTGANEMLDPLRILAFATGLVLLIACANVANLLLARAGARRSEIAVRLAVGATRARLIRQLLTESVALAVTGGVIGIALAYACVLALAKSNLVDPNLRFRPDLSVAGFCLALTLLTGILFGLAPAFRATGDGLSAAMQQSRATTRGLLGKILVAAQVAFSLALLVGAGLFLRTLRNLETVNTGFQRENIVVADIDPTALGYKGNRLRTFYDDLMSRARGIPGVRAAALSRMTPMGEYSMVRTFSAEGYEPKPNENLMAYANPVTAGYFTTFGIPILVGRDFRASDEPAVTPGDSMAAALGRASGGFSESIANRSGVCIINESFARRYFGNGNPVGRRLNFEDRFSSANSVEIVGVVKDVHHESLRHADTEGIIYIPSWSEGAEARWLVMRASADAAPALTALRRELRALDSNVPVLRTRMLQEYVNNSMHRERLIAYLAAFFGLLALALATVGLYGVVAYAVTQRTREVGIRMALGAQRSEVVAMIVRQSLVPILCGVAIGLGAAVALSRLVSGLLFGVAPRDPVSLISATLVMLIAGAIASAIPARKASRVDPVTALRHLG